MICQIITIVAVKVFRTITHNTHIIAHAMLIRVYTLMECPSAWCKNKTHPKNFCRDNSEQNLKKCLYIHYAKFICNNSMILFINRMLFMNAVIQSISNRLPKIPEIDLLSIFNYSFPYLVVLQCNIVVYLCFLIVNKIENNIQS